MAEPFLGEIRMFGGDFAPRGWARCHGQLLPISDHAPLFSLIGTTYGGDGVETFALPDLREDAAPAVPLPITFIIALAGVYPSRP
jgi:microcystin-dependent protein